MSKPWDSFAFTTRFIKKDLFDLVINPLGDMLGRDLGSMTKNYTTTLEDVRS